MDRIVENSYYDHLEHGLVKVVSVNNGVVSMEKQEDDVVAGARRIPAGVKQAASGFRRDAEPADVEVDAQPVVLDLFGNNI